MAFPAGNGDRGQCEGEAAGSLFAAALGEVLRTAAGVAPAPYSGGAFEGKEYYRIGIRLSLVAELLEKRAPGDHTVAFCSACGLSARLLPVLNRAEAVADNDISVWKQSTADIVDGLLASIPWVRVTPKLHTLCCHAPYFSWRFRRLGRYSEQGLEALHRRFNRDAGPYPSAMLLGSCRQFAEMSAIGGSPTDDVFNNGARRKAAKAGARLATRAPERRTRANRARAGLAPVSDTCREKDAAEVAKWASNVAVAAATGIRAFGTRLEQGKGPALAAITSKEIPGWEDDGLLSGPDAQAMMALLAWSVDEC